MRLLPAPLVVLALSGCNVAPSPALVAIDPEVADTTADLKAVVTAEALDLNKGDDVTYRYEWSQNGVLRTDLTSDTVPADATTRGDTWSVVVYAEDGKAEGPGSSASVSIVDAVPVGSTPDLDPAVPRSDQDVTCVGHAEDADEEALSFTYAWYVGGVAMTSDATLKHQDFRRGDTIYCTATPYDGEQHGDAVKSAVAVVADAPPVVTGLVLSTTSPQRGDDLSVTPSSTDFEGDPVTYAYAWYVDGSLAGSAQALTGAALERGDEVYVVVTPNDGFVDGDPVESPHLTVGNTPAEVDGVSLSPSPAYTNDTLTATIGDVTDADGDPSTVTYTWKVDGKVVQTGGLDTLDGAKWFSKDQVVTVEVTADDGSGAGPAATASLSIANTPPTMTGASISTTDVYEGSSVRCTGSGFSDVDGDGTQYKYAWYVNGAVSGDTARDIDGSYFDKHDDVYCVVSPYDGTDVGASKTSSSFTVQNTPPTPAVVAIVPASAASDGDDLQCTLSTASTDEDGDSVTYTYAWTEDGVAISETSSVLIGDLTNVGSSYVCVATPNDGETNGDPSPDSSATTVYPLAGNSMLSSVADVRIDGASSSAYFGQAYVLGDYDGDGVDDLLVGLDTGSQEKAYVFLGPLAAGTTTASKADVVFSPSVAGAKFGQMVSAAGDFDGDGLDDVMVGATNTTISGKGSAGAAYIFSGGATGPFTSADAITEIEGSGNGEQIGNGMAALGDVDGDGIGDVSAGAYQADPSSVNDAGEALVVLGGTTPSATVTASTADALITGVNANDYLGYNVRGAGDVNGDGYDDVLVSAHGYDGGMTDRGAVFLLYGPLSGTLPVNKNADVSFYGSASSGELGLRAPAAADFDGDGQTDFVLPVPYESSSAGNVYVVFDATSGTFDLSTKYDAKITGAGGMDLGWSTAAVSDLDGDGSDELLVGSFTYDYTSGTTTTGDVGLATLLYGGMSGTVAESTEPLRLRGEKASDWAGRTVSAGDLNDDGVDDLVIGAPYTDVTSTGTDVGSVFVVFGE